MAAATETQNFTEILPTGLVGVRLTTTGATSTYVCPYFSEIEAVVGNNESDSDGVGIGVSAFANPYPAIITITVVTSGDVVTLLIAGKP